MVLADHTDSLRNRRILVVEDDALVAMAVEAMLQDVGCKAVVVAEIGAALQAAESESIDIAFLDVSISGGESFVVAERLAQRGIPYLFTTAHDSRSLPARYQAQPVLYKPYASEELLEAVSVALATSDVASARKQSQ